MPIVDATDQWPSWALALIQTPTPELAWLAYGALHASFVCVALGLFFRSACATALLLHGYLWASSQHWSWFTMEQLSIILLSILLFSGAHETLSIHARRCSGSWAAWRPVSVLPQRLIALQVSATLLGAGWLKVTMPDWQDGTIVANAFMGIWATPLAFKVSQLELPKWTFDFFTQALRLFECSVSFGLWSRFWKWFLVALAVFLSINALLLSFWWFLLLLPSYVVFFEPESVAHVVARRRDATATTSTTSGT